MRDKKEVRKPDKKELSQTDTVERISEQPVFRPHADIYETDEAIHVIANMPGVDEHSVDITLEKNHLEIRGHVVPQTPAEMTLEYSEYAIGDYERAFVISDEIDRDGIIAKVRDGVLDLTLPRSRQARLRKIPITVQ